MTVLFDQSFERDLKKVKQAAVLKRVRATIGLLEAADELADIPHVKKLEGAGNHYRIRLGEFRLGFRTGPGDSIVLIRILDRKNFYRRFP